VLWIRSAGNSVYVQNTIASVRCPCTDYKSMFPNWSTHFCFIASETGKGNGIGCNIPDMVPLFLSFTANCTHTHSSCKQVFVEWHVDLKRCVGSLQTCSPCFPPNQVPGSCLILIYSMKQSR
jgi:hypothetical protein